MARLARTSRSDRIETVTVASMNLHCGVTSRGQPFDVLAAVTALDAQLIALQETWLDDSGQDPVAEAAEKLGARLFRVPLLQTPNPAGLGVPGDLRRGRVGVALLSTLPVTSYEVLELGRMRGDPVPRAAQIATVTGPGQVPLRFVATHLTHRLASPVQLARIRRHISARAMPTILAGDLNMPRTLARALPGFAPAVRGRTWPADLPLVQLDHILVSRDLALINGTVLPPAGSDHLPVRTRVRLRFPVDAPGLASIPS